MLRKAIFWIHLTAGVVAGLVILLMSATGVLLTYEKQMLAWADATDVARPRSATAARLPIDDLLASASAAAGGTVTGLTISSRPGAPALAIVGERTLALNPYSGVVLGDASPRLRAFFRGVTTWHRYIGAGAGELRQTLRLFTGWGNFLFLLIVVSGPFLWLPRKWTLAQVRNVAWLKGGLRGKARDFNWHNAIGIWSCLPLVVIVGSALPMSFTWANNAVYRLAGEQPPVRSAGARAGGGADGGQAGGSGRSVDRKSVAAAPALEPLWATAERQVHGWRTISARFGGPGKTQTFIIDRGTGGQPKLRGTLTVQRADGNVVRWETFGDQTAGRRARTFMRFAHTGEYFGIAGQTVAGLASAGAVVLVWTGLALALRRFRSWRWRRSSTATLVSRAA